MSKTPAIQERRAVFLGAIAVSSALLGIFAWIGYGAFATWGIHTAASGDTATSGRMALYAGVFTLAQFALGMIALAVGSTVRIQRGGSGLARRLGDLAMGLGTIVLMLLLILV